MGPSYLVVTARPVTQAQVAEFIQQQGGTLEAIGIYDGSVFGRHANVDIYWDTEFDKHWIADPQPFDSSTESLQEWKVEVARREELRAKLGTEPGAAIQLDLMRGVRSQWIAWRLIQLMFTQWSPCVVRSFKVPNDPVPNEIWTPAELGDYWANHHRLPHS